MNQMTRKQRLTFLFILSIYSVYAFHVIQNPEGLIASKAPGETHDMVNASYPHWPMLLDPASGTMSIVVLKVGFPDQFPEMNQTAIDALYNGSAGSLRDFYETNSYGQFSLSVDVFHGNGSWEMMPNNESYYDAYSLVENAIMAYDPFVNFSQYEKIIIYHDGEDKTLHDTFGIQTCAFPPGEGVNPLNTTEKWFYGGYCVVSEEDPVGVVAHEFGHCLGLPDEYDYNDQAHFCDGWSLMDVGCWNRLPGLPLGTCPAEMMAFDRIKLGWIQGSNLVMIDADTDEDSHQVILDPLETKTTGIQVVKIVIDVDNYYLVEFRKQVGYDRSLPGEGVLITWINENLDHGEGIVNVIDAIPRNNKNHAQFETTSLQSQFQDSSNRITIRVDAEPAAGNQCRVTICRSCIAWQTPTIVVVFGGIICILLYGVVKAFKRKKILPPNTPLEDGTAGQHATGTVIDGRPTKKKSPRALPGILGILGILLPANFLPISIVNVHALWIFGLYIDTGGARPAVEFLPIENPVFIVPITVAVVYLVGLILLLLTRWRRTKIYKVSWLPGTIIVGGCITNLAFTWLVLGIAFYQFIFAILSIPLGMVLIFASGIIAIARGREGAFFPQPKKKRGAFRR
jgi:M6 family metalloprotease-like protein